METIKSEPKLQSFNFAAFLEYAVKNPEANVYYHPNCTWWTHTSDDFHKKTDEEFESQRIRMQQIMHHPDTTPEKREHVQSLLDMSEQVHQNGNSIPMAPDQCPLMVTPIIHFIATNMESTERCGKYGLHTLMAAHHQNCGGLITKTWSDLDEFAAPEMNANRYPHPDTSSAIMKLILEYKNNYAREQKKKAGLTIVRELPKIHRNDLCLCGSGKKYKHCHGA